MIAIAAGLVLALAPIGTWYTITFGPFEAKTTGFGAASASGMDGSDSSDTTDTSSDGDGDLWLLGSPVDGILVTLLGLASAGLGVMCLQASKSPGGSSDDAETKSHLGLAGIGTAGFLWVLVSWFHADSSFKDAMRKELSKDEMGFGALFLGSVEFDPGWGLIVAGLASVAIGVAGALAWRQSRTRPTGGVSAVASF